MTITLEAIRAAGGIVHSDGNIFFRDISMLQGLAGAAPAAVAGPAWSEQQVHALAIHMAESAPPSHKPRDYDADMAWARSALGFIAGHAPAAPALEAPAAPDLRKTRDKAGILHYLTPEQMAEEIVRLDARLAAAPQAPAAPSLGRSAAQAVQALQEMWDDLEKSGSPRVNARAMRYYSDALSTVEQALLATPAAPVEPVTPPVIDAKAMKEAFDRATTEGKSFDDALRAAACATIWRRAKRPDDAPDAVGAALVSIAIECALHAEERHSYLPDTPAQAATWRPHDWVLQAMSRAISFDHMMNQAAPAAPAVDALSQAARDVLAERARQVNAEGFSHARDDQYVGGQLAGAAASYLILAAGGREDEARAFWPWRQEWLKPSSQRRYLEKACALGLAEMERMDRSAALANGGNAI